MTGTDDLANLENPIRDVRNAILYNIKSNAYVGKLIKNFGLDEPVVYKTSIENIKHYDCPAVGAFYPLELPFEQTTFAENIKRLPGLFFIDVVVEDIDYVISQDNCLALALYITRILSQDDVKPLPDENGKHTCYNSNILKIVEIGANTHKTNVVQFAYRIHLQADYHWSNLIATI